MKTKGFVFTSEAILTLVLAALLILSFQPARAENLDDLALQQKIDDLLIVWTMSDDLKNKNLEEMQKDFKFVFPQNGGELKIGEEQITFGKEGKNAMVISTFFLGENLQPQTVTLTVFR